jgi:hypothetical protein
MKYMAMRKNEKSLRFQEFKAPFFGAFVCYLPKVLDGSLKPLATVKSIEKLWIPSIYKLEQYRYLYNNLPNLKYGNISETISSKI